MCRLCEEAWAERFQKEAPCCHREQCRISHSFYCVHFGVLYISCYLFTAEPEKNSSYAQCFRIDRKGSDSSFILHIQKPKPVQESDAVFLRIPQQFHVPPLRCVSLVLDSALFITKMSCEILLFHFMAMYFKVTPCPLGNSSYLCNCLAFAVLKSVSSGSV